MYMGNIGAMGKPLRRLVKPRMGSRPTPAPSGAVNPRFQRYGGDVRNIDRTISREGILGPSRYMHVPSRRVVTIGDYDYEYDPQLGFLKKIGKAVKKGVKKVGKVLSKIAPVAAFIPGVGTAIAAAGAAHDVYQQRKDAKAAEQAGAAINVPQPIFDPVTGTMSYGAAETHRLPAPGSPVSAADVAKMLEERDAKRRAEQEARRREREISTREAALRTAEQNRMLMLAQAPQGPTSPAPVVERIVEREPAGDGGLLQNPGVLIGGAALLALLLRR